MLHEHRPLVGEDAQHTARLAAISAREDLDRIVAMNIQTRHLLSKTASVVSPPTVHCSLLLNHFGGQRNDLQKFLLAQFTGNRPKNACAYRLPRVVTQHGWDFFGLGTGS